MVQLRVLAASCGPRTFGARPAAAAAAARDSGEAAGNGRFRSGCVIGGRRAPGVGSVIGRAPGADTPAGSPAK
jgi:hypothetical protein